MRSLYQELAGIPDFRRGQGRKHTVASVLAVYILARLANMRGPVAAAEYAQKLSQRELEAIGAWKNPKTGIYVPVSKSTLHRVIASLDPEEVEAALQRYTTPRLHPSSPFRRSIWPEFGDSGGLAEHKSLQRNDAISGKAEVVP